MVLIRCTPSSWSPNAIFVSHSFANIATELEGSLSLDRYSYRLTSLPEVALAGIKGSRVVVFGHLLGLAMLLATASAAGDEDDNSSD